MGEIEYAAEHPEPELKEGQHICGDCSKKRYGCKVVIKLLDDSFYWVCSMCYRKLEYNRYMRE